MLPDNPPLSAANEAHSFWTRWTPQQRWWLLALASGLVYLIFAVWMPLRPFYNVVPQKDIFSFTSSVPPVIGYAASLLALLLFYAAAYRLVAGGQVAISAATIVAVAAVFGLFLLFVYPINATDIYRYYIRGRVTVVYGVSPYMAPPDAFAADPYLLLAGEWSGQTSPYGPLWELTAAAITRLVGDNLWWALLSFKVLALTLFLAAGGLIWRLSAALAPPARRGRLLLWLWNPPLLLTFVANGHNDMLMIALLLAGWLLLQRGRALSGWWVLSLAPLAKPIGLLALPVIFLWQLRRLPGWPARLWFALPAGGGSLLLVYALFQPFGSPLALARRLLFEARSVPGFSPVTLILLLRNRFDWALSDAVIGNAATGLFGLIVLALLWRIWRGGAAAPAVGGTFAAYLLQAFSFRLWYATWLFPWFLLGFEPENRRGRFWFLASAAFLATTQFSVLIYGHFYRLVGSHFISHLLGIPFTFGLPLLLAYVAGRYRDLRD